MRRDNLGRWNVTGRGQRNGARRLPENQRRRVLARYPACWLALPGRCTVKSTQVHHMVDAADGGADDDSNLVGVCFECHEWLSAHNAQKRSVARQNEWKRQPEKHPGVLD